MKELNEKMSFKMGVTFAASFYMGKSFSLGMPCIYVKVPEVNYSVKINKINKRYGIINV